MKKNEILICLLITSIIGVQLCASAEQLFTGGGKEDYENGYGSGNIPMPSTPTYNSNSNSDTSTSQKTYTKPVAKTTTFNGAAAGAAIGEAIVQQQAKEKQQYQDAIKKQIEKEAKQAAEDKEKKKQQAQQWLNDYSKVQSLKKYDPLKPTSDYKVPSLTDTLKTTNDDGFKVPDMPKLKPIVKEKVQEKDYGSVKNEGEFRKVYYNADRELMQCANGSKICSPAHIKDLEVIRSTAESQLSIHYNYKFVDGKFIKSPY